MRTGALIATDRRVNFYGKKWTGYDLEVLPYSNISSIEGGKSMMGSRLTLFTSNNKVHVKWISAGDVDTMVREIRNRIRKKAEPIPAATSNGIDELERYAALMDRGLITREEFDHNKRQVLGL